MKRLLLLTIILNLSVKMTAQVGINTETPQASLDIVAGTTPSEKDGLLIPRLDEFPTGVTAAQDGMLVFMTGNGTPAKGFYFYNHTTTNWIAVTGTSGGTLDQAYDFGGAGAGNTITATDGVLTINGEDGLLVTGTFGSGETIVSLGVSTRMFFNPRKSAFRVGTPTGTLWDNANIGNYSTSFGFWSNASGNYSTSFGYDSSASGSTSFSAGSEVIASGNGAIALGNGVLASGLIATAFGDQTNASGIRSTAFGVETFASGTNSIAFGTHSRALSFGETSIGIYNTGYTPNSLVAFDGEDRLFNIGNGTANNARSDAFTILKNGNVGFGVSDPQNPLEIGGSNNFDLSYLNSGQDGIFILGGNSGSLDAYGGSISFGPPSPTRSAQRKSAIASVQTSGDIDHTGLAFFVHGNAINQSDIQEGMRLTHNKRLGINNTAPSANLDVIGTLQYEDGNEATGYVLASDATGNATWTDPSTLVSVDDDWQDVGADIERQTGDVYIGDTAATNNKLVVSGVIEDWDNNTYVIDPDSDTRMNEIIFDIGDATDPSVTFQGATSTGIFAPAATSVGITTNGTERFRFTNKSQLEFLNSGTSVFIGNGAGDNDDLNNNRNVFIGENAGRDNDSGSGNVFTGYFTGLNNETGSNNIASGNLSLRDNVSGFNNIAIGWQNNVRGTGSYNITMGDNTAVRLGTGDRNVMIGPSAGNRDELTSSNNVYLGSFAGGGAVNNNMPPYYEKSGNVFLGNEAGRYQTASNTLIIENTDADEDNALIYGEFGADNTTSGNVLRTNGELQIGNPSGTGYSLPTNQGSNGDVLTSNGDGTTQWASENDVRSIVRANLSGSFQNLATNVSTQLELDTVLFDTNNDYDTTNYRFVAPRTGYYEFNAKITAVKSSGTGNCYLLVYKNGTLYQRNNDNNTGSNITRKNHGLVQLDAGDYLEVFVSTSGADWSVSTTSGYSFLDVTELKL